MSGIQRNWPIVWLAALQMHRVPDAERWTE